MKSFGNPANRLKQLLDTPEWSEEDRRWLLAYFEDTDDAALRQLMEKKFNEDVLSSQPHPKIEELLLLIHEKIKPAAPKAGLFLTGNWKRLSIAASVAAVALIGYFSFIIATLKPEAIVASTKAQAFKNDVAPGRSGAVLTLSDGRKIVLDSALNGVLAMQGNIKVEKNDGQIVYHGKNGEVLYNNISTDRGRQWSVTLPDSSKVWLNAASSIYYPLTFSDTERLVEVTGEAYFEVVHHSKQPFRVKVADQTIEDLGTHFNINAYKNETAMRTTLLEGSVKINNTAASIIIQPGQQAVINTTHKTMHVIEADVDDVVAWKNRFFAFREADIHAIMRQLSRWYDVDIRYEGIPSKQEFTGKIDMNLSLAQVLKILDQTGAHFRIEEDKRIVILP